MEKIKVPALLFLMLIPFLILSACETSNYPFLLKKKNTIEVDVPGNAGPWDTTINADFPYSSDVFAAPVAVGKKDNFPMDAGDVITITYKSGLANSGGGGIFNDADGETSLEAGYASSATGDPSQYIDLSERPVYLGTLIGVFTDGGGKIIGRPHKVGNGPISFVIPEGASAIQMGFNDGAFFDNGDFVTVEVTEE